MFSVVPKHACSHRQLLRRFTAQAACEHSMEGSAGGKLSIWLQGIAQLTAEVLSGHTDSLQG